MMRAFARAAPQSIAQMALTCLGAIREVRHGLTAMPVIDTVCAYLYLFSAGKTACVSRTGRWA